MVSTPEVDPGVMFSWAVGPDPKKSRGTLCPEWYLTTSRSDTSTVVRNRSYWSRSRQCGTVGLSNSFHSAPVVSGWSTPLCLPVDPNPLLSDSRCSLCLFTDHGWGEMAESTLEERRVRSG